MTRHYRLSTTEYGGTVIVEWTGLKRGDDGQPFDLSIQQARTIQAAGVFGVSGMLRVEGSNDGTNWAPLNSIQGYKLEVSLAKLETFSDHVRYIRPVVVAGDEETNIVMVVMTRRLS